ncbi:hypothetical protein HPB48_019181 [Haemaphysalis longicornis]|uniref:Uncharacterized protein n=1 Tax=Haemaphysalis longicornis TaxID=44386 RepID=A0A9J6FVM0_HAELO|nr:hypothetical protein HPB48_019181 [Haemaphysalis longicornis]
MLRFYNNQWQRFQFFSEVVRNLFAFHNQHWLTREREDNNNAWDTYQLPLVSWRGKFFPVLHAKVTMALTELIV